MASLADPAHLCDDTAAQSLRDLWISEMWATVPQYDPNPRPKRAESKTVAAMRRERYGR